MILDLSNILYLIFSIFFPAFYFTVSMSIVNNKSFLLSRCFLSTNPSSFVISNTGTYKLLSFYITN